ncbi:sensor histidine kinase [Motilimonas pumila]|uniref:Sensor histidine kinase n=1 Tax=Motilimonas pumila TaxID=2303987 RepID=A0A418YJ52_9GAMM|nr:histidine kinase [Motilimonas pumila]RJG50652.1 sensor histidine kinase [Motilimonas pumila]
MEHVEPTSVPARPRSLRIEAVIILVMSSIIGLSINYFGIGALELWKNLVVANCLGVLCLTGFYLINRYSHLFLDRLSLAWLLSLPIGILLGFWLHHYIYISDVNIAGHTTVNVFMLAVIVSLAITWWLASRSSAFKVKEQLRQSQLKQSLQEKELILSQLQLLQSQVEPHFLFNTLANLQATIQVDSKKAIQLLDLLTQLLRQSLSSSRKQTISLEEELNFIGAYLAIHKIRLGGRFDYQIDLADDISRDIQLPPLLLQPWVENAIIYGIEPSEQGGNLYFTISRSQNLSQGLKITIKDTGGAGRFERLSGLNIHNTKQRLLSLFDGQSSWQFKELNGTGFLLEMEIPYVD